MKKGENIREVAIYGDIGCIYVEYSDRSVSLERYVAGYMF